MIEVFNSFDNLLKTFYFVAFPASLIFIIQTIMTFAGVDSSDGVHADFSGNLADGSAPFQLFSLRNLINFLLGFGWSGVAFYPLIQNRVLLIFLSLVVGVLFLLMFWVILKQLSKLSEDNSFKFSETIGKTAEVYLAIPANNSGKGKVLISVRGSVRELDAITSGEKIATGQVIKVIAISGDNILVVESL